MFSTAAIAEFVMEVLSLVPQMIQSGIAVIDLIAKARAALDANAAPGDDAWDEADRAVSALQAQLAIDPS